MDLLLVLFPVSTTLSTNRYESVACFELLEVRMLLVLKLPTCYIHKKLISGLYHGAQTVYFSTYEVMFIHDILACFEIQH